MTELDELVAQVREQTGYTAERAVLRFNEWTFGERVRIVEDDDGGGLCSGEEGVLVLEEVGAVEFANVRVSVGIVLDGSDEPLEVDPDNIEAAD